jgi:hypothetical protein
VGAGAHVEGILLTAASVTMDLSASLTGRILARTFVALLGAGAGGEALRINEPTLPTSAPTLAPTAPTAAPTAPTPAPTVRFFLLAAGCCLGRLANATPSEANLVTRRPASPPADLAPAATAQVRPATDPIDLGTAIAFGILAETGISTVPSSGIAGDIGVSPAGAATITGFALVLDGSGALATSAQVAGDCYAADYAAPTPAMLAVAIADMEAAYGDAASRSTTDPDRRELAGGRIAGARLTHGVYSWTTNIDFDADVTFVGAAADVFILQTTGNVVVGDGARVRLEGGVLAENIFWQVGGAGFCSRRLPLATLTSSEGRRAGC